MSAFENILIIGFAGKKESGGFGANGGWGCVSKMAAYSDALEDIPPPGSRGFMLGDILGLRAGLT